MRPADHPEFFLRPAPAGASRESTIRLDGQGRFWHDDALVEHPRLSDALHQWISRHPENGRYILTNGYDWTYFTVDDVPYFVTSVSLTPTPTLHLSDGSTEPFPESGYRIGRGDALYCAVKGGAYEARFTQSAQTSLEPLLGTDQEAIYIQLGSKRIYVSGETTLHD